MIGHDFFGAYQLLTLKRKSNLSELLSLGVFRARNWQKEITFLTDCPSYYIQNNQTNNNKCKKKSSQKFVCFLLLEQKTFIFCQLQESILSCLDKIFVLYWINVYLVSSAGVDLSVTNALSKTWHPSKARIIRQSETTRIGPSWGESF